MTCARITIVKTTWLLLETKITWQDRWLEGERERAHNKQCGENDNLMPDYSSWGQ